MAEVPVAAKEEASVVVMEVVLVVAKEEGEEGDSEEGEDLVEGEDLERPAVETAVAEEKERLVGGKAAGKVEGTVEETEVEMVVEKGEEKGEEMGVVEGTAAAGVVATAEARVAMAAAPMQQSQMGGTRSVSESRPAETKIVAIAWPVP